VRLVVAEQEYDRAVGTPKVRLPAFAAVFTLKHPERFGEVVEEAWQKALGLINFTRGQQAQPGPDHRPRHAPRHEVHGGVLPPAAEGERSAIDIRFNFRPTLARVGDRLILSSTEGLARDLIDAAGKEVAARPPPIPGTHSLLEIEGAALLSILRSNRDNMVSQNMVEKGTSREEAEGQIDLLILAAGSFERAKLSIGTEGQRARAELELRLRLPRERRVVDAIDGTPSGAGAGEQGRAR